MNCQNVKQKKQKTEECRTGECSKDSYSGTTIDTKIGFKLDVSGFSDEFNQYFEKRFPNNKDAYLAFIDDSTILHELFLDFKKNAKCLDTVLHTKVSYDPSTEDDETQTCIIGPGIHEHIKYNVLLLVEHSTMETSSDGDTKIIYHVAIVSFESMKVINDYVRSLKQKGVDKKYIKVFHSTNFGWSRTNLFKRDKNTIFIGKLWDEIESDISDFLKSEKWYRRHGIPYKRTYLFKGNPGTGKSSTIRALCSHFDKAMYNLNLSSTKADDSFLSTVVQMVARKNFMVIEDIDRLFSNHDENISGSQISFPTLLNVLDGTQSKDGIVTIITCNNANRISDVMKRKGRIDKVFEFKEPNRKIIEDVFLSYHKKSVDEAKEFTKNVIGQKPTMADLQEFFVANRKRSLVDVLKESTSYVFNTKRQKLSMYE